MSISTMKKLVVITPSDSADRIISKLIKLRCVEVRQAIEEECGYLLKKMDCDKQRSEAEKKIAEIKQVLPVLTKYSHRRGGLGDTRLRINREEFVSDGSYDLAWEKVLSTSEALKLYADREAEILACKNKIAELLPWFDYDVRLDLSETANVELILGTLPKGTMISSVEEALEKYCAAIEFVSEDLGGVYALLICHKNDADDAVKALASLGFVKIKIKDESDTPKEAVKALEERIEVLEADKHDIENKIRGLSEYVGDVEVLYDIENTDLTAVISKQKMAKTENCAVLVGWVPEQRKEKITEELERQCCAFELEDPLEGEEPPVLLNNNKFAENFEWVIGMYSYPKYGSYDPTFIMSIFYFIMFGLMFADVGYGLILTVAGFAGPILLGMSKNMKRSFNMFGYCGISCMIMGVIFGGWFGDLPYAIMENMVGIENAREAVPFFNGLWFNPLDDPMTFLIVSLAVGGVHLVAGMAIQFVLLCKEGKVFDAIFDIGAWWVIFAGIGLIFLAGGLVGGIVVGVGVAMIVFTHGRHEKNIIMKLLKGLLGLYDVTSYASDLLSYSRILALGLAAGVIAQVVNLIGTMGGVSVGGFIALILACLIGHTLNLAINILGSFVHTSRLQYLEFFNKFYVDGGKQFVAVEPTEKYTKD